MCFLTGFICSVHFHCRAAFLVHWAKRKTFVGEKKVLFELKILRRKNAFDARPGHFKFPVLESPRNSPNLKCPGLGLMGFEIKCLNLQKIKFNQKILQFNNCRVLALKIFISKFTQLSPLHKTFKLLSTTLAKI